MSWSVKSWSYQKAIKAAIKLCMHVICYQNCIQNMYSKLSWSSPALSPSSNTLDSTHQLIRRDWNGLEKVELRENVPGYVCNPGSPRERDAASRR